jgi:prepilin-type N-terminal cleavage/methylation domain-containing protein
MHDGFTLVELLVVLLIIGVLVALLVPNYTLMQERTRRTAVRTVMRTVDLAMQAYAADNNGSYPLVGSFEKNYLDNPSSPGMSLAYWFPGGDPVGVDGSPIPGLLPTNPYTSRRYNAEDEDMDGATYFGDLDEPGLHANCMAGDPDRPYISYSAPGGLKGRICIASYVPEASQFEAIAEYGIFGFGRDVSMPMFDFAPDDSDGEPGYRFFVLHN